MLAIALALGAAVSWGGSCFLSGVQTRRTSLWTVIVLSQLAGVGLMAVIVLKERVSVLRWALVVGTFSGTLFIIQPGSDSFNWAILLPLALLFLLGMILLQRTAVREGSLSTSR